MTPFCLLVHIDIAEWKKAVFKSNHKFTNVLLIIPQTSANRQLDRILTQTYMHVYREIIILPPPRKKGQINESMLKKRKKGRRERERENVESKTSFDVILTRPSVCTSELIRETSKK